MRPIAIAVSLLLTGCVMQVAPPRPVVVAEPPAVYVPAAPRAVVSVYVEPPVSEPEPIAIGWAPPPMLVESPPPPPFEGAVWVGGYWVWQGDWVWAHGRWVGAPRPNYVWVHPYYEHRDGLVIFITGHWSPPGVVFVPPPPGIHLSVEIAAAGVVAGPRPMGPNGCFVPAPPGSRAGIIVPAPIGTAPAVVTGAPPVVAVGMRVTTTVNNTTINRNNTVVNNATNNVTNVRNVTNITNVTIVAPATATASGQAVNATAPAQAHLAAAQSAVVKARAPEPASAKPIPAFVHGRASPPLPPAQSVNAGPQDSKAQDSKQARTPRPPPAHGAPQVNTATTQAHGSSSPAGAAGASPAPPKPGIAPKVDGAHPAEHPVAANLKDRPGDPARHINAPNPPNAKTPSNAKNSPDGKSSPSAKKGEHEKKPGGKDEKPEHDKQG